MKRNLAFTAILAIVVSVLLAAPNNPQPKKPLTPGPDLGEKGGMTWDQFEKVVLAIKPFLDYDPDLRILQFTIQRTNCVAVKTGRIGNMPGLRSGAATFYTFLTEKDKWVLIRENTMYH